MLVHSLPCPSCKTDETIEVTEAEWIALSRGAYIQDALSRFTPDVRERFITGYCPRCWDQIFGGE